MNTENIYVVIVKILAVSADAYILFDYFDAFYQRKVGKIGFSLSILAYMTIMMITSYISTNYFNFIVATTIVLVYALILYKGNVRSRIISTFVYVSFILICDMIVVFSINLLVPATVLDLQADEARNIPFLIYAKILVFIFFKGVIQMKKSSQNRLLPKDFAALIFVSFISLFNTLTLFVGDSIGSETEAIFNLFVCIGLFISNIVIFNLFLKSSKFAKIEMEQSLILQNIESSKKRYDEVVAIQNQIKSMWHDINNHIACVKEMIKSDESAAGRYIAELEKKVGNYATQAAFGNSIIDTILYTKTIKAKELGIDISTTLDMDKNIKINPMDLCTIFSNALDNAIEACEEVAEGKRFIRVKAVQNQGILYIKVVNSSLERKRSGNVFKTTKRDHNRHGIGLKSIQSTVDIYSGSMNAEYNDGVFELSILLNT